jgi:hypothetical protein
MTEGKDGSPLTPCGDDRAEKMDARLLMWGEDEEKDGCPIKNVGNDGVRRENAITYGKLVEHLPH